MLTEEEREAGLATPGLAEEQCPSRSILSIPSQTPPPSPAPLPGKKSFTSRSRIGVHLSHGGFVLLGFVPAFRNSRDGNAALRWHDGKPMGHSAGVRV